MASWLPGFGEEGDVWDPDDATFIDEVDSSGNYLNPIFNKI